MEGGDRSMSNSIENRIVGMTFNNSTFQKAAADTLATLEKIKSSMDFKTVGTAVSGLPVEHISRFGSAIERLSHPIAGVNAAFIGLTTVAVTALSRMTNSAITAGTEFAKQFSGVAAAKAGFDEYGITLNATQTMMAATGESVEQVTKTLENLNAYSDTTIYSFRDMTDNIAKFTNAGLSSKEAAAAIKGVANVAAASGASANEAARSMYNFAQAMSAGVVKAIDWRSIELANMGTIEFKQQLIDSAVAMGTLIKTGDGLYQTLSGVSVTTKQFSTTLAEGWLTADALNATLARYSDNTTKIGAKAQKLAQQVKTLPQALDIIKETMGSGWSETFRIVIGDLEEASKVWTAFNETVGGAMGRMADRRNELLQGWDELGGRKVLIEGLVNVFEALKSVLQPIYEAFRDIFPPATSKELFKLTKMFRDFTEGLIVSKETGKLIGDTFRGLFAVIGIGIRIFKNIVRYIFDFFSLFGGGTGGVLEFTASIGRMLVAFDNWIKQGVYIRRFFNMLMDARRAVLEPIIAVVGKIFEAFAALVTVGPEAFFEKLAESGNLFKVAMDAIREQVAETFSSVGSFVDGFLDRLGFLGGAVRGVFMVLAGAVLMLLNAFGDAGDAIADFFNFGSAGDAATSGTKDAVSAVGDEAERVGGIFVSLWNALKAVGDFIGRMFSGIGNALESSGIGEFFSILRDKILEFMRDMDFQDFLALINTGFLIAFYTMFRNFFKELGNLADSASGVFNQVSENLRTMQRDVRANIVMKIAAAVALLAASLWVLSTIPVDKLAIGVGAIGSLMVMMSMFMGGLDPKKGMKPKEMIARSAAMSIMATGMVAMATAITVMAAAVKLFGNMELKELAQGLGAVGLVMASMVVMTTALSRSGGGATMIAASIAMTILAGALTVLAGAVLLYEALDASTLADGLLSIALTIGVLVATMNAMPRAGMIRAAAALLIVAGALNVMGVALKIIASISAGDTAQVLITLGVALGILVGAMHLMQTALPGAAALFTVSKSLLVLAIALKILGSMSFTEVLIALGAIAGVLIIFGVAGAVLAPVVPIIAALGAAMLVFGAGLLAAGAGMLLFSAGLALLATVGTAGFAVIMSGIVGFLELLPIMVQQFGLTLRAMLDVIIELAPLLGEAIARLLEALFNAVIESAPELGDALIELVTTALKVIRETVPDIVETAWYLTEQLARAFADHIGPIIDAGIDAFVAMMKAIRGRDNEVADEIVKTIISVGNAIAEAIRNNSQAFKDAGWAIADAILDGFLGFDLGAGLRNAAVNAFEQIPGAPDVSSGGIAGDTEDWPEGVGKTGGTIPKRSGGEVQDRNKRALEDTRRTLDRMGRMALEAPDVSPTITPVLDLSQVERDAAQINDFLSADTSYLEALSVAADREAQSENPPEEKSPERREVSITQSFTSPKALSEVDVYRSTRNAVAIAREELNA